MFNVDYGRKKKTKSLGRGKIECDGIGEKIVVRLVSLIRNNQLGPGDRLPPERELATIMGVSRSTLREGLRALSILNLIETRQGDGTYISSLDQELLVEPLIFFLTMDSLTLSQLFETRRILEIAIAGLAASRISPEELEKLRRCMNCSVESADDPESFLARDIELHEGLARATHNPILSRFVMSLRVIGKASRERTVRIPGLIQRTIEDHSALIEALEQGDPIAARKAMSDHLDHIEASLQALNFSEIS